MLSALQATSINGLAISSDGNKLVAATSGYIYTSTNSGTTWVRRAGKQEWLHVASSSDGKLLVAAAEGGMIYTSSNSGATWVARASKRNWVALASSGNGKLLVAASDGPGLFTSRDAGKTWVVNPKDTRYYRSFALASKSNRLVAIASSSIDIDTAPSLFSSSNLGFSWAPLAAALRVTAEFIQVASSSNGKKLVAIPNYGRIYTSTNYGATWVARGIVQPWLSVASSSDGNHLTAAADPGKIYTSRNSGATWVARGSVQDWLAVVSSSDGSKLVAATFQAQICISKNAGSSWVLRRIQA